MRGRVKVTVVIPFSCVAMALVMSWLASIGGWERARMFLYGRWERNVTSLIYTNEMEELYTVDKLR